MNNMLIRKIRTLAHKECCNYIENVSKMEIVPSSIRGIRRFMMELSTAIIFWNVCCPSIRI